MEYFSDSLAAIFAKDGGVFYLFMKKHLTKLSTVCRI